MDHASQRLFQRTAPIEAERAFALLRDRPRLQRLLESTVLGAAPDAERIALPLDAGEDESAPRLLVTREGRAVTCLGRGMPGRAVAVPWPAVERYLRDQDERVRLGVAIARYDGAEGLRSSLGHAFKYGHRVTRAEWHDMRALAPLLTRILDDARDLTVELLDTFRRLGRSARPLAEEQARALWGVYAGTAHLLTAAAGEHGAQRALARCAAAGDVFVAGRAAWILVNHPERTIAFTREALATKDKATLALVAAPLLGIAWRFSWHRQEALALVAEIGPLTDLEGPLDAVQQLILKYRSAERDAIAVAPVFFAMREPLEAWGTPEETAGRIVPSLARLLKGHAFDDVVARLEEPEKRWLSAWRPFACAFQEPRVHPLERAPDAETGERWQLWREAEWNWLRPLHSFSDGVWALFTCMPIEALIPADEPDPLWAARNGAQYLRERLTLITTAKVAPAPTPVRVEKKPGPNEPCSCGSGRKFKKCCGGEGTRAKPRNHALKGHG